MGENHTHCFIFSLSQFLGISTKMMNSEISFYIWTFKYKLYKMCQPQKKSFWSFPTESLASWKQEIQFCKRKQTFTLITWKVNAFFNYTYSLRRIKKLMMKREIRKNWIMIGKKIECSAKWNIVCLSWLWIIKFQWIDRKQIFNVAKPTGAIPISKFHWKTIHCLWTKISFVN